MKTSRVRKDSKAASSPRQLKVPAKQLTASEYKIVCMRECPYPNDDAIGDNPEKVAAYWRANVPTHPYFSPDVETFTAILLNTRRRIKGHHLLSQGTLDTILVHPREVFRAATIGAAAAVVIVHNHPSGDPTPSESDIKATRDLIRAGMLLKIDVLDHLIMGRATADRPRDYLSLRALGYFDESARVAPAAQQQEPLVKRTVEAVVTKNGHRASEAEVKNYIARQQRSSNEAIMRNFFRHLATAESLDAALSIVPRQEINAVTRFCFRLVKLSGWT